MRILSAAACAALALSALAPASVRAQDAETVRVVDHQTRAVLALELDDLRQLADVAFHREHAVDDDQAAAILGRTLEQMTLLRIPAEVEWELLVVNNNSTDDTDVVAERFADRLPLRLLQEPTAGKSHALNRAVREASGEYLLFTDDDVLVDEEWIAAYTCAFRRWPDAAIFGGPIRPWFDGTPPS